MRTPLLLYLLLQVTFACAEPARAGADASSGVVLQYHHVDANTPPATSTSPDVFRAQMAYLAANNYQVWPLDRLVQATRTGVATPDKTVAITFDDAYTSIYDTAFPILRGHGFPFTVFVATQYVGTNPNQFLSWAQLNEMRQHGALVANHTHSHTHLLRRERHESHRQWLARVQKEIVTAGDLITTNTGDDLDFLAYPYGEYDTAILDIIDNLGYTGFGQQSGAIGPASLYSALPRYPMGGIYSAMEPFMLKVDTLALPIETLRLDPMVGSETRPILELTFSREDLRLDRLVCYGPNGEPTELTRTSATTFRARSTTDVPVGRSRYNCTMPVHGTNRFYWFSQMWIRKTPADTWYPEP